MYIYIYTSKRVKLIIAVLNIFYNIIKLNKCSVSG